MSGPNRPIAFKSQADFERAMRAARTSEKLVASPPQMSAAPVTNQGPAGCYVKITGDPVGVSPVYWPAKFAYRNAQAPSTSDAWYFGDDCFACGLNENDVLQQDFYYFGLIVGQMKTGDYVGSPLVAATVGVPTDGIRPRMVEITAEFDLIPGTGYAWKELVLDYALEKYVDPEPNVTGQNLFEVADNKSLLAGSRAIMWQIPAKIMTPLAPVTYACQVQEEFPAKILTPDAGPVYNSTFGYTWQQINSVTPIKGRRLYEINGNQNMRPDDVVWIHRLPGNAVEPGYWYCDRPLLRTACGLKHDPMTDKYYVDPTAFAGTGLTVSGGPFPDCIKLNVNQSVGCGLEVVAGAIKLKLTDVIDPDVFAWDNGACTLSLKFDCGLYYNGTGLAVNHTTLAGTASVSSLIPLNSCGLGVDLAVHTSEFETLVNNTTLTFAAGQLCLDVTKSVYSNKFNAAGLLIDRILVSGPTTTQSCVDLCAAIACCAASPLAASCTRSPSSGTAPLTVNFTTTASGGVPGYVYFWTFGDGGTDTTANPSHVYTTAGTYSPHVDVTDTCGNTVRCSPGSISVTAPVCCGVPDTLTATLSAGAGGTTSCACLNGTTIALTRDMAPGQWSGNAGTGCGGCNAGIVLTCSGDVWRITTFLVSGVPFTAVSQSCTPLSIVFHATGIGECCGVAGGSFVGSCTITITAP